MAAIADRGVPLARVRFTLDRYRRQLAIGGLVAVAALVVVFTVLPAPGAGVEASEGEPTGGPTVVGTVPPAVPEATPAATDGGGIPESTASDDPARIVAGDDPVAAARVLVAELSRCRDELSLSCLEGVAQAGSPLAAAESAAITTARDGGEMIAGIDADVAGIERIGELDGLGDAVLVRVPGRTETEPASLLMMRGEAGWRLREWFG
ncbi:hypothetical protein [Agromyces seonyuensis]|uniref:Uncharacterized protein n=1 Tax=Agromyces seonyuensis TaxID=2662446 RepID=A0A6I4NSF1_9MICO|nr:hypothetical protein [Agromyces seonyuensis]MWB97090.1 hypothetical protein [Agromyces seonyuensis]